MALAYKPNVTASKKEDITTSKIPRIPFIYSYSNAGGGLKVDNYRTTANIVITGIVLNLQAGQGIGNFAAVNCKINGITIIGQGIDAYEHLPTNNSLMVNFPEWDISANSLLQSATNCTAGCYATITWIGYFK